MNEIVTQQAPQVPAYLQRTGRASAFSALASLNSGSSIHQISIKGSRWRLQDSQGAEVIAPTLYLDVILVGTNPNRSKVYYAGTYNPADTEFKAPDCYSDNGVGPSSRATSPQSASCATCPHNVWGSKISPNGSQTKACSDSQKLAVILADNPGGPVYLLKVPAASLKNLGSFVDDFEKRNIDVSVIVARLEFDPATDYPKIKFSGKRYISEEENAIVERLSSSEEVQVVTGIKDRATAPATAIDSTSTLNPASVSTIGDIEPEVAPKKRTRAKSVEPEVVKQNQEASTGFFDKLKAADAPSTKTAAASVVVNAQPTSADLDQLLAQALKL